MHFILYHHIFHSERILLNTKATRIARIHWKKYRLYQLFSTNIFSKLNEYNAKVCKIEILDVFTPNSSHWSNTEKNKMFWTLNAFSFLIFVRKIKTFVWSRNPRRICLISWSWIFLLSLISYWLNTKFLGFWLAVIFLFNNFSLTLLSLPP